MLTKSLYLLLAVSAMVSPTLGQSPAQKVADLRLAASMVDRVKLLQDNEFVFDFLHPISGESDGGGGHTVSASVGNFPALVGTGMAMTIGFLGPCGYNTPHTHPRATEFNFAVNGTLQTGFLAENGARFVFNEVPPGSAAIFPKGVIHFEMNTECEDVLFVAAFNDEDPGVDQIAQRFFGLPPKFVAAALGDIGIEQIAGLESKIPNNVALGTEECLKRCGLTNSGQPTSQRQPRVAANALPSGYSGPSAAAAPSGTPTHYATPATSPAAVAVSATASPTSLSGQLSLNDESGKTNPVIIALIVIVGVLLAGYAFIIVGWCLRRRNEKKSRSGGNKYFKPGADFAPQAASFHSDKGYGGPHSTPYDPPTQ
ncbi:hypothetical protein NLI96_g10902 [Meripilus lineatus]|uniref:Cupin type-1 domain-containing protein n=1 Tax=Meripilus lineatus TaxID=2056292 RepID=A0AAD5UUD6_9APHY|nr:hypothetical protein NLI96_g10902 [Physisporinus lineatus]